MTKTCSAKSYSENFLINAIGFNVAWFACISLGNPAIAVVAILLVLHLYFHRDAQAEIHVVLIIGLLGYSVDTLLTHAGVFAFSGDSVLAPIWLLFLWFAFAATLRQSLGVFARHVLVSIPFGAICGGLAYAGAMHLGAVTFPLGYTQTVLLVSGIWAVLFPLFIWLSHFTGARTCPSGY